MKVKEVAKKLGLEILSCPEDAEVRAGYVSDLLSDVIANAPEGAMWITVQRHPNVLAVAQLRKLAAIVISGGIEPDPALVQKAEQEGVCLCRGRDNSFQMAGKLHRLIH